jgi:hypothetical protein
MGLEARGGHEDGVGLLLEAGASPEEDLTVASRRPSHLPVDRLLWPSSTAVSGQNKFLS